MKAIVTVTYSNGYDPDSGVVEGSDAHELARGIQVYLENCAGARGSHEERGSVVQDFAEIASHTVTLLPKGF